ncbi:hypothetical protein [Leptospira sp. GIMC2001]|uniref:hypothetical protein n=1 Tax=Leptospira sp. GIMC2001 TaxID=1513297 RepID=UPI00234B937E|nr:hypothetical protein [Leptospira sp. GIMC2001]WCL50772.1 hypothetical protein O4O04_08150 [Leptospira sp. GIMC2001]
MEARSINSIDKDTLIKYPLWGYIPSKDGSLWIKPVKSLTNLKNRMVTAEITFRNGTKGFGFIEFLRLDSPNWSKHNRVLWLLLEESKWFRLTKYYNHKSNDPHGPEELANQLGMRIEDVFPIHFEAQKFLNKESEVLSGLFEIKPKWGVSHDEAVLMKG